MYCRVRVTCHQNGEKLFESTATGISKNHADRRAAKKILEEPSYGAKAPNQVIAERKMNNEVTYILEKTVQGQLMQKCLLKYSPGHGHPEQEYPAEGISVKLAKAKAAYSFLCATFGPDQSKKQVSFKMENICGIINLGLSSLGTRNHFDKTDQAIQSKRRT